MRFNHKEDHSATQNAALRRSLSVLFALFDFCLAERMFDSHFGFGRHDLDFHPKLPPVILNNSNVGSMDAPDAPGRSDSMAMFCSVTAAIPAWRAAVAKWSRSLSCRLADLAPLARFCMQPKRSRSALQPGRTQRRPAPGAAHPSRC